MATEFTKPVEHAASVCVCVLGLGRMTLDWKGHGSLKPCFKHLNVFKKDVWHTEPSAPHCNYSSAPGKGERCRAKCVCDVYTHRWLLTVVPT